MLELELAPDPFFGVMGMELPSPIALPKMLLEEIPPPPGPPLAVSPEAITLREPEPERLVLPRIEEELPEVTLRELELLSEAEAELGPPGMGQGSLLGVGRCPELPQPHSGPGLCPIEEEVPEVPELVEVPPPILPAVPPIMPPPAPRRRRRRLPYSDPEPQLPQAQFQAQLLQPQSHCQPLVSGVHLWGSPIDLWGRSQRCAPQVLPEPPKRRRWTPKQLLETPTCGWLPPSLWAVWNRCRRLPRIEAPPVPPELPSEVEVLREALEPSLPPLPSAEVSLEVSEEEPRPRLLVPEERL
ncbi:meiotic recombination protein REC8 homolog [Ara ararauna]